MTRRHDLDSALRARAAGRTWDQVATLMGVSVSEARELLAPALAANRTRAATALSVHAPAVAACTDCGCAKELHTRVSDPRWPDDADGCSVHKEYGQYTNPRTGYLEFRPTCYGFVIHDTPEQKRFDLLTAATHPGHTRSTWYYLRESGVLPATFHPGGSTKRGIWYAPPVLAQQARDSVQVRRGQKKARRVLAREFPNGRPDA